MEKGWAFDTEHYTRISESQIEFSNQFLPDLIAVQGLKSALDVGCGVGYFSNYLSKLGLEVSAFDGRPENVKEAQIRHRDVKFLVLNVEDSAVKELGSFDLIFCFGLLYHLENPFLAIRNLYHIAGKMLIVESMVIPRRFPSASLVNEGPSEDQSLNFTAFIPSESCLVKMLYCAGFPYVYGSVFSPKHEDYHETYQFHRKRTILVAAKIPLELSFLCPVREPVTENLWLKPLGDHLYRLYRFLRRPWREKTNSIGLHLKRFLKKRSGFLLKII